MSSNVCWIAWECISHEFHFGLFQSFTFVLEKSPARSRTNASRAMNSPSLRLARRLDGSVGRPAPIRLPPQFDFDFGSISRVSVSPILLSPKVVRVLLA